MTGSATVSHVVRTHFAKDKHERSPAAWVRSNVPAKSCLAREAERIHRGHRADQHHAQCIAAGRFNGPAG